MFTTSTTRRLAIAVAIAGTILCGASAARAQSFDDALNVLKNFKNDDAALRSAYRELIPIYQNRNTLTVRRTQAEAGAATARGQNQRDQYFREVRRIDDDIKKTNSKIDSMENAFKTKEKALIDRINSQSKSAFEALAKSSEKQHLAALREFCELFLFDVKTEIPDLRASASFSDNESWLAAADTIGAIAKAMEKDGIAELRTMLTSRRASTRYAAARGLGIIGPPVEEFDPRISVDLKNMLGTANRSNEDRSEKERRVRIVEEALQSIKPKK